MKKRSYQSAVVILSLILHLSGLQMAAADAWVNAGSMNVARNRHTATRLPNGGVLVAGGRDSADADLSSAELYDPVSGTWTMTGAMNAARSWHTATLLTNGQVLCAAGGNSGLLSSSELYDPSAGTWTLTGNLNTARYWHTATLLSNGNVLVTGGAINDDPAFSSTELYDPDTGTWTFAASLNAPRQYHTATLLPDGQVLVVGGSAGGGVNGSYLSSSELYSPANGTWTITSRLKTARAYHTATLLTNGKVLVAGGVNASGPVSSSELYDPGTGNWTPTGGLATGRAVHTAILLRSGEVLVAGGTRDGSSAFSSSELYSPTTGTWLKGAPLRVARFYHTATLLPNGAALVVGGAVGPRDHVVSFSSAEMYSVGTPGPDVTKPTISITNPSPSKLLVVSNAVFTAAGKCSDNVAVSNVFCAVNNGGWVRAGLSANGINWTAAMTLAPGTNMIAAYAVDTSGNLSTPVTGRVDYVVSALLAVAISPSSTWGTVSPNDNGRLLQIGKTYSVTARANAGFKFVGWSGTLSAALTPSANPALKFLMSSNLSFTANFVDIAPPVCVITYPAVGHTISNSPVTATIKASDNVGVAAVFSRINGGGWKSDASSTDGTNWTSAELALTPGANTLQAYAADSAGNHSKTNTVAFKYVAPVTGFAPASLSGYEATIKPSGSKQTLVLSWGDGTWAQTGTGQDTNAADYCVGTCTYVRTSLATALLTNTDIALMAALGTTNVTTVSLTFTGPASGSLAWTNGTNSGSGTMTISPVSNLVPASLAGKIVQMNSSAGGPTITLNADGTFLQTQEGRTHTGTYTFTQFSPTMGILEEAFTDASEGGARSYAELVFTSVSGGTVYGCYYQDPVCGGNPDDAAVGAFIIK